MAKSKNAIKIEVTDEDEDTTNELILDKESGEDMTDRIKKTKRKVNIKPLFKRSSKEKVLKKKAAISEPAKKTNDKMVEINLVEKAIDESENLALDKFKRLREFATRGKDEKEMKIGQPVSQGQGDKTTRSVKDIISSSLKEEETKREQSIIADKTRSQRSIKLYKKIALSFIFLTLLLLAIVAYFTFSQVTIVLIPNQERISNNMIIDIYDKDKNINQSANAVKGVVALVNIVETGQYQASGTEVIGEEVIGQVKIINDYTKNQPLVASTRLLTPDGLKLYHLKNTVNVPAGGSLITDIYADEIKPESAIATPIKFTIPGLWAGLQDKIYAESFGPIVYQQKVKQNITQTDIDSAKDDLRMKIVDKAKADINESYRDYTQIIYKLDEDSVKTEIDGQVGEEKDSFKVEMLASMIAVAFNGQEVADIARQKFISSLPENKELTSFDESNMVYSLNNFNADEKVATINVTFEGKVTLKEGSNIIDVNKILGLNDKELNAYLAQLPDIAGYEVVYYPSFIKRVPNLVDRVKVEIKK